MAFYAHVSVRVCTVLFTLHTFVAVLADLPLPTPLPTPLEETVLGTKGISPESKKILDSANPTLCSRITEALLSVDTSFL